MNCRFTRLTDQQAGIEFIDCVIAWQNAVKEPLPQSCRVCCHALHANLDSTAQGIYSATIGPVNGLFTMASLRDGIAHGFGWARNTTEKKPLKLY